MYSARGRVICGKQPVRSNESVWCKKNEEGIPPLKNRYDSKDIPPTIVYCSINTLSTRLFGSLRRISDSSHVEHPTTEPMR